MKKPKWVIEKEQSRRAAAARTVWLFGLHAVRELFGLHAVRDALLNPARERLRLVLTKNAADKLGDAIAESGMTPEIVDPRKFSVPIDPGSVHQGAALEVKPLPWGSLEEVCLQGEGAPLVLLLDRVTDPHNVGAILRSAEVVIAPARNSAPETGALAKTASGALERQPYLKVRNLADTMEALREMGFLLYGMDGEAGMTLDQALAGGGPWIRRWPGAWRGSRAPVAGPSVWCWAPRGRGCANAPRRPAMPWFESTRRVALDR